MVGGGASIGVGSGAEITVGCSGGGTGAAAAGGGAGGNEAPADGGTGAAGGAAAGTGGSLSMSPNKSCSGPSDVVNEANNEFLFSMLVNSHNDTMSNYAFLLMTMNVDLTRVDAIVAMALISEPTASLIFLDRSDLSLPEDT